MKNVGIVLIMVAVAIVTGAITYAAFNPSTPSETTLTKADFREPAKQDAKPASQPASAKSDEAAPAAEGGTPVIEVKSAHDMGIIKSSEIAHQFVSVKNTGDAPLRISKVSTSCGCTQGKMEKDVIPPGEEARLEVTVDPSRVPKFYSEKVLTIFSNDPQNAAAQMSVAARVDPEIEWDSDLINFGEVPKGEGAEKSITVRQLQELPFEITSVDVVGNEGVYTTSFALTDSATWKDPQKREYAINIKVNPNASVGHHPAKIQMKSDLARLGRGIFFDVTAEVVGVYSLHPMRVTLKDVQPGLENPNVLTVKADTEFEIAKFVSTNDNLNVEYKAGEQPNTVVFNMTLKEGVTDRLQRDSWELTIVSKGETYIERVPVLAIVRGDQAGHSTRAVPQLGNPAHAAQPGVTPNPTAESLRAEHEKGAAAATSNGSVR